MEWIKVTVTKITNEVVVGFLVLKLREIYFKKSASEARQKTLFYAEQIVDIFGIGLPIVHDWRFWFMPIVGNKNIHNLGVFRVLKSTPSNYL